MDGRLPRQPVGLFWHLLLFSQALLNFVIEYKGQSLDVEGQNKVVCMW